MDIGQITQVFTTSFRQASGNISVGMYSGSIRFIASVMLILAVMWSVNHFMDSEEKQHEAYLIRLGSRLISLIIGLTVFLIILISGGK